MFDFIADLFFGIVQEIIDALGALGRWISELPTSPFQSLNNYIDTLPHETVAFINWFIPIPSMLALLQVWLSCIAVYYAVKIPLRWVKALQG